MPDSTLTPLTVDEFREYIKVVPLPRGLPTATCAHHTWKPTTADWQGRATMEGIRRYHMGTRGWSDIGANFYVGPDRLVWTARPLTASNWAHALVSLPWSEVHAMARAFAGWDEQALNRRAVGVEIIGNYDLEDPRESPAMETAFEVFAAMHEQWGIPLDNLFFHRMVADKTCPGSRVGHNWFVQEVRDRMNAPNTDQHPHEWAAEGWEWATEAEITDGTNPRGPITREQVVVMLKRFDEWQKAQVAAAWPY